MYPNSGMSEFCLLSIFTPSGNTLVLEILPFVQLHDVVV